MTLKKTENKLPICDCLARTLPKYVIWSWFGFNTILELLSVLVIWGNIYWLTSFADSFFNSDWPELVIYFHNNEQVGEQNSYFLANV